MQTFVPYPDILESVRVLDRQRLGKQRVEAYQILRALTGVSKGWIHHPAVKMWKGHEGTLAVYAAACCQEWTRRGYADGVLENLMPYLREAMIPLTYPSWWGDDAVHASHRSNLLRKMPEFYGQYGWSESPDLPYVWRAP